MRRFSLLASIIAGSAFIGVASASQPVNFDRDIRPILSNKCFACHGPDDGKRQAGLRLDDQKVATHPLESGAIAIVPDKPNASELIRRVTSADKDERMPPAEFGKSLSPAEIAILRTWIKQGAHYAKHWSYVKPVRTAPPTAAAPWQKWPRNAIDQFALQTMLSHSLHPSPEADRYALARRIFLDLTGLPPTVEEVDTFVRNKDPHAYEKLVDDLLHRPSYGEHWARMWLDLARYADSAGYADDPPRTIWAYRDWVIKAFNENMPFDEFTIEQIAGDLLPHPTQDQLIATAFHRNTMTNNEGGTQDEEFRNAAIVDRVNTTMAVWMGTTMACAQCHNHKFDPISQREYFQLFAIFNNTEDADRHDEAPVLPIYSDAQRRDLTGVFDDVGVVQSLLALSSSTPTSAFAEFVAASPERRDLKPITTVPIQRELTTHRRETRLEYRGNYLDKGPLTECGLPSIFPKKMQGETLDRLALARWLVDKDNPLTARVVANRYWEILFGRGIV
ncbi:MAG TPA: DUF1549 domain-containing protein, partial [Lacipirellulaceae bacterium]|nr:DUF1549 domain-containing protein [Lacipirellulaceae bacterium]